MRLRRFGREQDDEKDEHHHHQVRPGHRPGAVVEAGSVVPRNFGVGEECPPPPASITFWRVVFAGTDFITFSVETDFLASVQIFCRIQGVGDFEVASAPSPVDVSHQLTAGNDGAGGEPLILNTNYECFAQADSGVIGPPSNVLVIRTRR